jgi:hypothetical protein
MKENQIKFESSQASLEERIGAGILELRKEIKEENYKLLISINEEISKSNKEWKES